MRLKKELGQHFLKNEAICTEIVASFMKLSDHTIPLLEIGPGAGAITKYLMKETLVDYKMVEIDTEKALYLVSHIAVDPLQIINQDFLKIDPPFPDKFNIIGNFPYNISTQIMFKIIDWKEQVETVVGMFQKEVAIRIASNEGNKDYGILSVIMQAFYNIEYLFDVPPTAFTPPPKVMSGVISLQNNHNANNIIKPVRFIKFVKACFAMRRKTLRNNLKGILSSEWLEDEFFTKRAEQVSVATFIELYKKQYES